MLRQMQRQQRSSRLTKCKQGLQKRPPAAAVKWLLQDLDFASVTPLLKCGLHLSHVVKGS